MSTKDVIERVIKSTFTTIKKVYDCQKEYKKESEYKFYDDVGSRIVFPTYSDRSSIRISEQELRFIFVEQFNKVVENLKDIGHDLYYSVETPTREKYIFSKQKGGPIKVEKDNNGVKKDENGVSARTDLTILKKINNNNFERVALIEFKALNPETHSYSKDICKLENEGCELKYFIQIIEKYDGDTIKSLNNKTYKMKDKGINYRCCCLDGNNEDLLKKLQACKSLSTAE